MFLCCGNIELPPIFVGPSKILSLPGGHTYVFNANKYDFASHRCCNCWYIHNNIFRQSWNCHYWCRYSSLDPVPL